MFLNLLIFREILYFSWRNNSSWNFDMRLQLSKASFDAYVLNRFGDLNFCGKISSFLFGGYENNLYFCQRKGISTSIAILTMPTMLEYPEGVK